MTAKTEVLLETAKNRQAASVCHVVAQLQQNHCYYCKRLGHLKPGCLKLKANQSAKEANKATGGGEVETSDVKYGVNNNAHTILADSFRYFNIRDEDHFFFSQVTEPKKIINLPHIWLLLDSKSTIDIIVNKLMVSNIKKSESLITFHCKSGLQKVEYTADLIRYRRVWYDTKSIKNILSLSYATRRYQVVFDSEDGNCFSIMLPWRKVVLNMSTNRLY